MTVKGKRVDVRKKTAAIKRFRIGKCIGIAKKKGKYTKREDGDVRVPIVSWGGA